MGQYIKKKSFRSIGSCEGYNYDWNIYIGRFNHKQCRIVKLLSPFGFRLRHSIEKVQLKSCINISAGPGCEAGNKITNANQIRLSDEEHNGSSR